MADIFIKDGFTLEEAAVLRARNPKAKLCDKNNFSFFEFAGKKVKAEGKDKLSTYLYDQAIKAGAKA